MGAVGTAAGIVPVLVVPAAACAERWCEEGHALILAGFLPSAGAL